MSKYFYSSVMTVLFLISVFSFGFGQVRFYNGNPVDNPQTVDSLVQGDMLFWQVDCQPGATVQFEIWMDLDNDHAVSEGDFRLFSFPVTDGDNSGNEGPADEDGMNGKITTTVGPFGFAPITWVMTAQEGDVENMGALVVKPLDNPMVTVSGTISFEDGHSPENVLVATDFDNNPPFWNGVADAEGHYTINIGAPGMYDIVPFLTSSAYLIPEPIQIDATSPNTITGVDFVIKTPDCMVEGDFLDDGGNPMTTETIELGLEDLQGSGGVYDEFSGGHYQFGIAPGTYRLAVNDQWLDEKYMAPATWNNPAYTFTINSGDTITRDITFFRTDAALYARILKDGIPVTDPAFCTVRVSNPMIGTRSGVNGTEGMVRLAVRQGYLYHIQVDEQPQGYGLPNGSQFDNIAPGDTVDFNFVNYTDSVRVAFQVDAAEPVPNWQEFAVWAMANNAQVSRMQLENGDTTTLFIPGETVQVGIDRPDNYVFSPQYAEANPGDVVTFTVKNAAATITGKLHGLDFLPGGDMGVFAHTPGQFPDCFNAWSQILPDTSYQLHVSSGAWLIDPPIFNGYQIEQSEVSVDVTSPDATIALDFYYTPVTGIKDPAAAAVRKFDLQQNYPNPFNPTTNITFTLPEASRVLLEVYNVLGEKVNVLLNGKMQDGQHSVKWNGENAPAGIYFYVIKAGKYSAVRKMKLVK